jgi:hypothetical protein
MKPYVAISTNPFIATLYFPGREPYRADEATVRELINALSEALGVFERERRRDRRQARDDQQLELPFDEKGV